MARCRDLYVCCVIAPRAGVILTPADLCAGRRLRIVMYQVMAEGRDFAGFSHVTAGASVGLFTLFGAGRCSCHSPLAEAVAERGNDFLCNQDFVAARAVFAFCQAGLGACCRDCRVDHLDMTQRGNGFLCDQNFVAARAVFAFCQAGLSARCSNCRVDHLDMAERGDFYCFGLLFKSLDRESRRICLCAGFLTRCGDIRGYHGPNRFSIRMAAVVGAYTRARCG